MQSQGGWAGNNIGAGAALVCGYEAVCGSPHHTTTLPQTHLTSDTTQSRTVCGVREGHLANTVLYKCYMYVKTDTAPRRARAMHARGRDQAEPNGSPTQNPTPPVSGPPLTSPSSPPTSMQHGRAGGQHRAAALVRRRGRTKACVGHTTPHHYSTSD